jgi:hypothetical protein
MNQSGVGPIDIIGGLFFILSILSAYFMTKKRQSFIIVTLPYSFLALSAAALYADGRQDWYAILICLPLIGLIHAIYRSWF